MVYVRNRCKAPEREERKMWMVEWAELNPETDSYEWNSDCWDTWEEVVMIVHDCITDPMCGEYRITCFG